MAKLGLKIMVDCNDPPMFRTDPTDNYVAMADHMGFGSADFRGFVLNGIDGSWLDDDTKRLATGESREIDDPTSQLTDCGPWSLARRCRG